MNQNNNTQSEFGCLLISVMIAGLIMFGFLFSLDTLARAASAPKVTKVVSAAVTQPPVTPTAASVAVADNSAAALGYDPAKVADGQKTFSSLCAACHGQDAHGLPNLGKDLVTSEFVHSLTDEELLKFVKTGRPMWDPANTTGIDMPPKGGNPALTDVQILDVVAYLRTLGGPGPNVPQPIAQQPTKPAPTAAPVQPAVSPTLIPTVVLQQPTPQASSANVAASGGDIANGQKIFSSLCAACHGQDAHGLPKLGKDLVTSEFVGAQTDKDLLKFVKTGRPMWDPANTTGIDMPPKGGNPALTDAQIVDVIAYLRSLRNP